MKTPQKTFHEPVMVDEVLHYLITDPSGIYVDGTLGGASHAEAVLSMLDKKALLIGIDRDNDAIETSRKKLSRFKDRVRVLQGSFGDIDRILVGLGIRHVHGLFLDLGLSSHQIDTAERGFSYFEEGPLDMRMDRNIERTASEVVNRYAEDELAHLFRIYGEERNARRIARHIVMARGKSQIQTTTQLAAIVRKCVPPRWAVKTLARVWQALRIEVNEELEHLKRGLESIVPFFIPGSRMVALCYQALEDRLIKNFFRGEPLSIRRFPSGGPEYRVVFKPLTRAVRPSEKEIERNSRASSARLRAAEYTG